MELRNDELKCHLADFGEKKTLAESLCENKIAENRLFGKDERFIGSSTNVMSRQKLLPLTCLL